MTMIWADPKSERQMQILSELSARVLAESDPQTLSDLIEQLSEITLAYRWMRPPN